MSSCKSDRIPTWVDDEWGSAKGVNFYSRCSVLETGFVQSFRRVKDLPRTKNSHPPPREILFNNKRKNRKEKKTLPKPKLTMLWYAMTTNWEFSDIWFGTDAKSQTSACCGCICGDLSLHALFIICLFWYATILCSLKTNVYTWNLNSCLPMSASINLSWVGGCWPKEKIETSDIPGCYPPPPQPPQRYFINPQWIGLECITEGRDSNRSINSSTEVT